jgi:diguanylate cyclase (GGDEF)-like protein
MKWKPMSETLTGRRLAASCEALESVLPETAQAPERLHMIDGCPATAADLRALLAQVGHWYWETDPHMRLTVVRSSGDGPVAGLLSSWLGGCDWDIPGELLRPASWDLHRQYLEQRSAFSDLVVRRPLGDGSSVVARLSGVPAHDGAGVFLGYVGLGCDISAALAARETLQRLSSTDGLTGLLNRQAFDVGAGRLLADAYAQGRQCALLCIGLDHFHLVNSNYGHRVGDRVLAAIAGRMRNLIGAPHLLGRRGGDEIVALLVDVGRHGQAAEVAANVTAAVAPLVHLDGVCIAVRASVGVGIFPHDGGDFDALLNAADAALYLAKRSGGGTHALYTPELARRTELRLRLEQRLRKAYESREFRLYYQPLVALPGGELVGAEALLRWHDAELGDINPGEFIPIAEESGLIEGVGDWVLREACRQRQMWRQVGLDLPPIAVNISGAQLKSAGFVDMLLSTLDEFDVATEELEIELTETGLLESWTVARDSLTRLRSAGINAALDDFGVGYSSLAHLRDLPMHRLKIDRSFTVDCMRDARTLTIVKSVIEMAHNLGLTVTAEGIETAEQQAWMHHLGCDSAQGYYFARPMPADEFLQRFLDRRDGAAGAQLS